MKRQKCKYISLSSQTISKMLMKILASTTFVLLIQVISSENTREVLFRNGPCMRYQYRCLNDNCISRNLFCNSRDDCGDNSDESYCSTQNECPKKLSYFRCQTNNYYYKKCIPITWRCDRVGDCFDNHDEKECDYNNKGQEITAANLQKLSHLSQSWILKGRKADRKFQKWGTDLPRKAISLYLSNKTLFEINSRFADEIAYELTTNFLSKLALKKIDDIPTTDIASYINAFLVTCIDPREFYVLDMVQELRMRMDKLNGTNPFALLAMCNAQELITSRDVQKLEEAFWIAHEKHRIDKMALIVLALSCASTQQENVVEQEDLSNFVLELKKRQYRNGTVENVKSTALVLQALFASEWESDEDNFDERKALHQILRSLEADGSFGNLANTYYVLPVLSGLSLVNISSEHCPPFIRDEKEGLQRLKDQVGEKQSVKYSLWIGDDRFIQRTLTVSVPVNTSFYGIMEYASDLDINYRFEYNVRHRKPYIYSLYGLMDDPEREMVWTFNHLINETSGKVKIIHRSPADFYPKHNDHFVYWYKSEE